MGLAKCIRYYTLIGFTYRVYISSSTEQNGRHFAAGIFRCIFLNEKVRILTKISLQFVPKGPIDINPALV